MLRLLVYATALMLTAGASWAGCANYTDGSMFSPAPRGLICFGSDCEMTTLDYACGNAHGTHVGYANGWRGSYDADSGKSVLIRPDGSHVPEKDHHKFTCYVIDEDFWESCPGDVGTIKMPTIDAGGEDSVEGGARAASDLFSFSGATLPGLD